MNELENAINDLKLKHNRTLHEHEEKFNKDAKFVRLRLTMGRFTS